MSFAFSTLAFIEGLGGPEVVMIMLIVLVLFGGEKLPQFARGLGKSIREFKKAAAGVEEEFKRAMDEDEKKNTAPKILPVAAPATVAATPALLPATPVAPAPPPSPSAPEHGRADV
jgi:sec-independent protein translocase protein TatA